VLIVSPNNPTGSVVHPGELEALVALCAERRLALIGDEVFADYRLDGQPPGVSVLEQAGTLAFALGGLSKSIGLPQAKVAWIAAAGPEAVVADALAGLELVADTFLSVSTPAQLALPQLLARGAVVRDAIRERTARNLAMLTAAVNAVPAVTLLRPAGGWCAVLQVPALDTEEALVLALLEHDGVLVQPGYFFDFPREAFVVVSLLVEPRVFDPAVARMLARAAGRPVTSLAGHA
jgi:aspartate/methionine/tyrosine aminotransferase